MTIKWNKEEVHQIVLHSIYYVPFTSSQISQSVYILKSWQVPGSLIIWNIQRVKTLVTGVIPSLSWLRYSQFSIWPLFIVINGCELMLGMPQNTQENSHYGGKFSHPGYLPASITHSWNRHPKTVFLPTCLQDPTPERTLHLKKWQMEHSRQWFWGEPHAVIFQDLSSLGWFVKTAL